MSADDYYSYHGGLIAAVRNAKGSAPRAYVGDSTDRSRVVMRSLSDEFRRVVQGGNAESETHSGHDEPWLQRGIGYV